MADNFRYGIFPLPIEEFEKSVDGELLTSRDGHVFVNSSGIAVSKTKQNEDKISILNKLSKFVNNHLILGNSDWRFLLNGGVNLISEYSDINKGVILTSQSKDATIFDLEHFISVSPNSKYYFSISVTQLEGDGNLSLGVKNYNNLFQEINTDNLSSMICDNPLITNKELTFSGTISGYNDLANPKCYKFDPNTSYLKPFIAIGRNRTSITSKVLITKVEIFQIPSYIDESRGLKNTYLDIDASSEKFIGVKVSDDKATSNLCLKATSNASNIVSLGSFVTNELKSCVYSMALRLKSSLNSLSVPSFRISVYKKTGINTWDIIKSKDIILNSTMLKTANEYYFLFFGFEYCGIKAFDNELKFTFEILNQPTNVTIQLDYVYILPSVVGAHSI